MRVEKYFEGTKAHIPGVEEFELKSCVAKGAARLAIENNCNPKSHLRLGVGCIGYFSTAPAKFVSVLPDKHEYPAESTSPIVITLNENGANVQDIYLNTGFSDNYEQSDSTEWFHFARINVECSDRPNQEVELYLGYDLDGDLTARVGNTPQQVEHLSMESDEEL
jgi:hypothetical protein